MELYIEEEINIQTVQRLEELDALKFLHCLLRYSALLSQVNIQNFETSNRGIYEV